MIMVSRGCDHGPPAVGGKPRCAYDLCDNSCHWQEALLVLSLGLTLSQRCEDICVLRVPHLQTYSSSWKEARKHH